jgi:hypothetical protein
VPGSAERVRFYLNGEAERCATIDGTEVDAVDLHELDALSRVEFRYSFRIVRESQAASRSSSRLFALNCFSQFNESS